LASVYHKPPESFVAKLKDLKKEKQDEPEEENKGKTAKLCFVVVL
jgi:hypothetical protein